MSAEPWIPTTGNDGRVIQDNSGGGSGGDPVILAGITKWDWPDKKSGVVPCLNFESPANDDGVIFPVKLRGAGDGGTVTIEGFRNFAEDNDTETGAPALRNGLYTSVTLVTSKTYNTGYVGVEGWIKNFATGPKVGNEAETFTCQLEVSGVPPEHGPLS